MSDRRKKSSPVLLTRQELSLMKAIWEAPEALTVRAVVDQINAHRAKPLAYTTVQTLLTILTEKRVLSCTPGPGRAHLYRALVSRDEVSTSMVGDLVERLYDGRVQPLLVHLVDSESISRGELENLRRWIDEQLEDDPPQEPAS